jgi:hypothetical protein
VTITPTSTPSVSAVANYDNLVGYTYTCNSGVTSYPVYQNSNAAFTGNQFLRTENNTTSATNPSQSAPNSAENWVNNGSVFCSGCVSYQPQINNNICSTTYNSTRNVNLGAGSPCNYDANYSSAVGSLCISGTTYTVYQNTNSCFTGNQFFANGTSYASNPSTGACLAITYEMGSGGGLTIKENGTVRLVADSGGFQTGTIYVTPGSSINVKTEIYCGFSDNACAQLFVSQDGTTLHSATYCGIDQSSNEYTFTISANSVVASDNYCEPYSP